MISDAPRLLMNFGQLNATHANSCARLPLLLFLVLSKAGVSWNSLESYTNSLDPEIMPNVHMTSNELLFGMVQRVSCLGLPLAYCGLR